MLSIEAKVNYLYSTTFGLFCYLYYQVNSSVSVFHTILVDYLASVNYF